MKEVKKLDKIHLDEITRLLKDPKYVARINDYRDGTRDYWIDGDHMYSSPLRIDYDKDAKEYILKLDTIEAEISYREDRDTVDKNPNSVIAGLTEQFIRKYNKEQHKKAESTRAEKTPIPKKTKKTPEKDDKNLTKLNKFHLATIDLIFKDPSYSAAINDYTDGTRTYFLWDAKYFGKFGEHPLRIEQDGDDYVLTMTTKEGKISCREAKGSVDKNPNSVIAKVIEKFIKKYNDNQHKKAKAQQQMKNLERR